MDGGGLDDRTLRRIIALLVSFAALAESAATRSLPIRWLVLTILRCAERVARDVLVDETGCNLSDLEDAFGIGGDPNGLVGSGNGPADAALLAWRLRTLASLLRTLLEPARHPDDWTLDLESWTDGRNALPSGLAPIVGLFAMLAGRQPAFDDTS